MPTKAYDKIICANSKSLSKFVEKNSVGLTVCSPPYHNMIDYETHLKSEGEMFRGNKVWRSKEDYLNEMKAVFDEVYKVTEDGGYCAIVIGYELVNKEIIPLPSLLISKLTEDGKWKLREEIIWNKVTNGRNGAGNRFGVTAKSLYGKTSHTDYLYYYTNIMHEYVFVLSKGQPKRILKEDTLDRLNRMGLHPWVKRELANSTWNIAPVPPNSVDHPCPFPEQIPWRLIQLYSNPKDLVLDPFNGSGQTTKVAKYLGRHYVGVDKEQTYVKLALKRLDEPPNLSTILWSGKWKSKRFDSQTLKDLR